jgi:hypothetical protein
VVKNTVSSVNSLCWNTGILECWNDEFSGRRVICD